MSIWKRLLYWIGLRPNPGPRYFEISESLQVTLSTLAERDGRPEDQLAQELLAAGLTEYYSLDELWKKWESLTPREREIVDALTGDHHFTQAGFNALLADAQRACCAEIEAALQRYVGDRVDERIFRGDSRSPLVEHVPNSAGDAVPVFLVTSREGVQPIIRNGEVVDRRIEADSAGLARGRSGDGDFDRRIRGPLVSCEYFSHRLHGLAPAPFSARAL